MLRRLIHKCKNILKHLFNRVPDILYVASNLRDSDDIEEVSRYLDDKDRRHYQQNGDDVYSVTTVLDEMQDGEPEGIKWWKRHNDGEGDNPDWRHILEYKKHRGTLAHHTALADLNEEVHGEQLWSDDESQSLNTLYDLDGNDDFLYSIVADRDWVSSEEAYETLKENEDISLTDVLHSDLDYFMDEFDQIMDDKHITAEDVEAVEEMFVVPPNHEHDGYGGQADLVYRDPSTGEAVVADLKTSSAVRDKHKYQAAAYSKAVEKTDNLPIDSVSRAEIIRIYPDEEESEVYQFNDFDQYWSEFAETTYEM